jgi:hypothetical protein
MIYLLGLVIAFILLLIYSNPETRLCRWREYRAKEVSEESRWTCIHCGATVQGPRGEAPRVCHRNKTPPGP